MKRRIVIATALGVLVGWRMWTAKSGAKYQPSRGRTVRRMLALARVKPGEVIYDLGSGDGRVLVEASRRFKAQAVGIELDPVRALWSRLSVARAGQSANARVIRGDLFDQDLSGADVVVCFLSQKANARLERESFDSLKPTARVVSNHHTFDTLPLIAEEPKRGIRVYGVRPISSADGTG